MRLVMLSLLGLSVFYSQAASEQRPVKGGQASYTNQDTREVVAAEDSDDHFLTDFHQASQETDDVQENKDDYSSKRNTIAKTSDSNARFFIRRFNGLKNLFGKKNQPIIIRIFLNGTVPNIPVTPTTPTVPTNPTLPTVPTPPDVPTIPTLPFLPTGPDVPTQITDPLAPTRAVRASTQSTYDGSEGTDDDISSSELPARLNYKHKVARKNQAIIVRIPAKYRHLLNNGQQVKLSSKNGVNRRRVTNRRGKTNRKKLNSNKLMKNKYQ